MNLRIREALASDYTEINNLVLEVHDLHVQNRPDVYINVETPMMRKDFDDLLYANDTKLFVVEDTSNESLLAYSIVKIIAPRSIRIFVPVKSVYIDDFCVRSSHQKNGIGRFLFQHIVEYAKAEGASSIQLTVWDFNRGAIKFYEALGMSTRNRRMELNL
jgi:ribosomal protein S18 acetylase RimI-like enzyme